MGELADVLAAGHRALYGSDPASRALRDALQAMERKAREIDRHTGLALAQQDREREQRR